MNDVSALRWDKEMAKTVAGTEVWSGSDAYARESGRVAHAAAARRHCSAGKAGTLESGWRRLWWRECGERKLHSIRGLVLEKTLSRTTRCWPVSRLAIPGNAVACGDFEKIIYWPHAGKKREKMRRSQTGFMGDLAAQTALIMKGAHIVRTHDVKAALDAARATDAILNAH